MASRASVITGGSDGIARAALSQDVAFAGAMVMILTVLFIPLPSLIIDIGLAFSIALSVVVLMVALWIGRPLEFSAFPTILLIATLLRLALNIATTRVILAHGVEGETAAGSVIAGFANFVMGGDFIIGVIVFVILITVNFLVITKGATRIAEVGARFTLDAVPGKQMAIDADVAAGTIDEHEAVRRRRELEEESSFFGAMDGASKFVRGDAIAGLIITVVNVIGGILIGTLRHDLPFMTAVDTFVKLSVGDGLVTQIPALIVSLAAGLLVSKGGTRGSADQAVLDQLGTYPRALVVSGGVMGLLALAPGLPFAPFAVLAGGLTAAGHSIQRRRTLQVAQLEAENDARARHAEEEARQSVKSSLRAAEMELVLGKQLYAFLLPSQADLAQRVARMRRKFARQYGFVVPEIRLTDDLALEPKCYEVRIHGTVVARGEMRLGAQLVIVGEGPVPDLPREEAREPAFGMKAVWIEEVYASAARRQGFTVVDPISVVLTHVGETVRNNLAQLLSYRDMRALIDRLDPEYKRLVEEIIPSLLTNSGLQSVLKHLLAERVSIRNLHLILEAVAEAAAHIRRPEQLAEHVRVRLAQQICGDLAENGVLKLLRLGSRWDQVFAQAIKRDAKGEIIEFDMDPRHIEEFTAECGRAVRQYMDQGQQFVLVTAPDVRTYVRMITERVFPTLAVLSHIEIARGIETRMLGSVS